MNQRQALLIIPGFTKARVVRQIADGISGISWLVALNDQRHVMRIDKDEARALGLNREGERDVQAVVARAGLTPEAVFHDIERGVSLRRWISGVAWSVTDLRKPANLERLGLLLRDLHGLPPTGPKFQPGEAASRYAAHLGTREALQIAAEANLLLAELRREPTRDCLCHNDLVAENLIDTGEQLIPIDWEYAGIGDPMFDLAVLIQHHELPEDSTRRLLQAYFRRDITARETQRVQSWCRFYSLLLKLWHQRINTSSS
jgi:thiamine kinase-like enzyme